VATPGKEVVSAQDIVPRSEQLLAQMRAEEAGAAGDQDALAQVHDGTSDMARGAEPSSSSSSTRSITATGSRR
jgi:hypothetical protein